MDSSPGKIPSLDSGNHRESDDGTSVCQDQLPQQNNLQHKSDENELKDEVDSGAVKRDSLETCKIGVLSNQNNVEDQSFTTVPLYSNTDIQLEEIISEQEKKTESTVPSLSSSDDSVCRVCQESSRDSGEPIQTTRCACKGATSKIHESCLRRWVNHQRSARCEICKFPFEGIDPPVIIQPSQERRLEMNFIPAEHITNIRQLYHNLQRVRPFNNRKRAILAAAIAFLLLVTCLSAVMTTEVDREYRKVAENPWSSHKDIDQTGIMFSICVASVFFCATITAGLATIWIGLECNFIIRRRALYRHAEIAVLRHMRRQQSELRQN